MSYSFISSRVYDFSRRLIWYFVTLCAEDDFSCVFNIQKKFIICLIRILVYLRKIFFKISFDIEQVISVIVWAEGIVISEIDMRWFGIYLGCCNYVLRSYYKYSTSFYAISIKPFHIWLVLFFWGLIIHFLTFTL